MLAVIETHPVQYHAPVYRNLQARFGIPVTAIYGSDFSVEGYRDAEFGARLSWDIVRNLIGRGFIMPGKQSAPSFFEERRLIMPGIGAPLRLWRATYFCGSVTDAPLNCSILADTRINTSKG